MDVTRGNFVEALAIVKSFLSTASFVSIDLEFTGLGESRPSQLDTPAVRYQTARADAEPFPPIQFGLSIFRRRPETEEYSNEATSTGDLAQAPSSVPTPNDGNASPSTRPDPDVPRPWQVVTFNFNIFPNAVYYPPTTRYPYYDRMVNLQSSSVHFLITHGFDFMKIFTEGISWVREETEKSLRKHITAVLQKKRNPDQSANTALGKENKKLVEFYREAIDGWLEKLSKSDAQMTEPDAVVLPRIKTFSMPRTSLQRRLVFDVVRDHYPRIFASSMATQERTQLKLELYASAADVLERKKRSIGIEAEEEISKAVGFRYVIDALRESRVPLVVHNGIMDMSKLFANFVSPMPLDLNDFKQELLQAFPLIYDTRWMMQQICDTQESVQKAIYADKARSMDEVIRTLRQLVGKSGQNRLPDVRTLVPTGSVDRNGKYINEAVLTDREIGFEIAEGARPFNLDRDVYCFGRYAVSDEGRYGHEAGFDAMETGKLFIILLHIRKLCGAVGDVDLRCDDDLVSSRNKIYLGSCGGYRYIDIATRSADEDNIYCKGGNVVVITGEWNEGDGENQNSHPQRRRRNLLKRVITGTPFDAGNSSVIQVGPMTMLAVLEKGKVKGHTGKLERDDTVDISSDIQAVIDNGKEIGVEVEPYRDVVSSEPTEAVRDLKRRRCA